MLKYLSPSSIGIYENDQEEFYQQYISNNKKPRPPQLAVMSIGSAFDSYVKSDLFEKIYGRGHPDSSQFEFTTIFENQVEIQNRTWAREHGEHVFNVYKSSGAFKELLKELETGSEVRFEFNVQGVIQGVPLLGKPDCSYISSSGVPVVLDFKVNGYLSKAIAFPGYIKLRDSSGRDSGSHRDAYPMNENGLIINISQTLDTVRKDFAQQLSIYSWLLGHSVGGDFVVGIEQVVCQPSGGKYPEIKVATHRCRIGRAFQEDLMKRIILIWDIVNSEHFFREISLKDSVERCKMLEILDDDKFLYTQY